MRRRPSRYRIVEYPVGTITDEYGFPLERVVWVVQTRRVLFNRLPLWWRSTDTLSSSLEKAEKKVVRLVAEKPRSRVVKEYA